MPSVFNNIWPASVNFHLHNANPTVSVPTDQPTPHYEFPAQGGYLPPSAIPANPGVNVKALISRLPSLFKINNGTK